MIFLIPSLILHVQDIIISLSTRAIAHNYLILKILKVEFFLIFLLSIYLLIPSLALSLKRTNASETFVHSIQQLCVLYRAIRTRAEPLDQKEHITWRQFKEFSWLRKIGYLIGGLLAFCFENPWMQFAYRIMLLMITLSLIITLLQIGMCELTILLLAQPSYYLHIVDLIYYISVISITIIMMAIALYVIRMKRRLMYASIEIIFGIATVILGAQSVVRQITNHIFINNIDLNEPHTIDRMNKIFHDLILSISWFPVIASVAGGLYIIIRGIDNMEKGFQDNGPSSKMFLFCVEWLGRDL